MTLKKRRFRPRLIPSVVALIAFLILLRLCFWQISRHGERNEHVPLMEASRNAPELTAFPEGEVTGAIYRRFALKGKFVGEPVLEAGRAIETARAGGGRAKQVGYAVLQVFETEAGRQVLVDRGELLRSEVETLLRKLPKVYTEPLKGQLKPLPGRKVLEPIAGAESPRIWPVRGIDGIHAWYNDAGAGKTAPLAGVYLRLGDELEADASPKRSGEGTLATGYRRAKKNWDSAHYALQWFAMSMIVVGMWLWASWFRKEDDAPASESDQHSTA